MGFFLVFFQLWTGLLLAAPGGHIVRVASMNSARAKHTATLLYDGSVLIAGGLGSDGSVLASAELFDPHTLKFTKTGSMAEARAGHSAVRLVNGTVLIIGGGGPKGALGTCEIYDPAARKFLPTASLHNPRVGATATRLQDNRVLVVGGDGLDGQSMADAEIYNRNATFTFVAAMSTPRSFHSATLLPHEFVLITGGTGSTGTSEALGSAELYAAEVNRFLPLPNMSVARNRHAAVALPDGNILIVGGSSGRSRQGTSTSEIFDVEHRRFLESGAMNKPRFDLPDPVVISGGKVLVTGGSRIEEVYDPATKTFFAASGTLERSRWYQSATPLSDGNVLIAGGADEKTHPTAQAWMYIP
jgi:hypothetical protein